MGRQRKARDWWASIPPWKRREIKERQQRENEARLREQLRRDRAANTSPDRSR